jgi:hypothetical protein
MTFSSLHKPFIPEFRLVEQKPEILKPSLNLALYTVGANINMTTLLARTRLKNEQNISARKNPTGLAGRQFFCINTNRK